MATLASRPWTRLGLRLTKRSGIRHGTTWARTPPTRKVFWAVPLAGGLTLCLAPPINSIVCTILTPPTVISCSEVSPRGTQPTILSPSESDQSIFNRIASVLQVNVWEPILTATRFIYLFILFIPVIVSSPLLLVGPPEEEYGGDRWGAVAWYGFLVSRMEAAGPTFIKLAQWAASRADLFPTLLCEKLGSLHSRGKPHDLSHTKRVIERIFQMPFDEVFDEFDETPIGTGAIAQVYKATLKKDLIPPSYLGPKRLKASPSAVLAPVILPDPPPSAPTACVAVKILHPNVSKLISRDLSIMKFFARLIALVPGMQWLSLPEEVEVFGQMMSQQLDLRHEANNLLRFEKNFALRNLPVTFPRPLKAWSTRDVLVEQYENALPLELFMKNGAGPYDEQLATIGLDSFLNMLLIDNFVHSDLHPGNIMIKFIKPESTKVLLQHILTSIINPSAPHEPSPADLSNSDKIVDGLRSLVHSQSSWRAELESLSKEGYIPEVVFVDAGLVTTLNDHNRQNFLDLFHAVAKFDGYRVGQLMIERCRTPELTVEPETFALKMQHVVLNIKRKTFSLGQIKISDILKDVLKAVRVHHVKMEGDFINTVISILLLEGIGRQLDPDLNLFKSALPLLRQLGRQMAAQDYATQIPSGYLGALLKVWVYTEARELASTAFVNVDDLVKYGWLMPSI